MLKVKSVVATDIRYLHVFSNISLDVPQFGYKLHVFKRWLLISGWMRLRNLSRTTDVIIGHLKIERQDCTSVTDFWPDCPWNYTELQRNRNNISSYGVHQSTYIAPFVLYNGIISISYSRVFIVSTQFVQCGHRNLSECSE